MPLYLAPYIGAGTRIDPYRPLGSDQPGWSAIQMRRTSDGVRKAWLWLPNTDMDLRLKLVAFDLDERASLAMRALAVTELGLTADLSLDATASALIARSLLEPPVGGWPALQPSLRRNQHEVWLGGSLIWSRPVISGGSGSYATNFTGADENPLSEGGVWEAGYASWGSVKLSFNHARAVTASVNCGARLLTPLIGADQYARATCLSTFPAGVAICGIAVRMHPTSPTDSSCYAAYAEFSETRFTIYEASASLGFTLLWQLAVAPVSGTLYTLEISGSTLTFKKPGTELGTVTDATIVSGQPGIVFYTTEVGAPAADLDSFDGGDLGMVDTVSDAGMP